MPIYGGVTFNRIAIRLALGTALPALASCAPARAVEPPPPSYEREIAPLLVTYCYDCHGDGSARGDVDLAAHVSPETRRAAGALWSRVWDNVQNDVMPPPGKPRPTPAERARLQAWIRRDVHGVDCRAPDPGRVTLRRLNRDEYDHSVAALFGIELQAAEDFPADDSGYGFDNIGDVLSVSPVLTEKYFAAAEKVVSRVVSGRAEIPRRTLGRGDFKIVAEPADKLTLSEARFSIEHAGPHEALLRLSVNSFRPFTGKAQVSVTIDDRVILRTTYRAGNRVYRYPRTLRLAAGEHVVRWSLDLRDAQPSGGRAITIALDELSVTGPIGTKIREYPPAHRRLFFAGPAPSEPAARASYRQAIVEGVATRAFRRPVPPPTLQRLLALAEEAEAKSTTKPGAFEAGIAAALQAILVSPRFLFRAEEQPRPDDARAVFPLDEHALAARLSYLLHASGPDPALTALADRGALRANLRGEVSRLLADTRAERFVARFVGQWLQTRDVENVAIDTETIKGFSPALRKLMRSETELLFLHLLRNDRDVLELITADYSFLNQALAKFYDLPPLEGSAMRKVALPAGGPRGGILTHGSFLTVTSNPTRTSPVKRGLFVLDNLLGAPPPPPPPNVPNLEAAARDGVRPKTVRAQLALHREKPACASCHARMDPIGLGLERFDAVGRWRDSDGGQPIDATGTLVSGESIGGVEDLRASLGKRRPQFYQALSRKLLVFALGRGLEPANDCTVEAMVAGLQANGGRLSAALTTLVESPPFQARRGGS